MEDQLLDLYYLVLWKCYSKKKNIWEPVLPVQHIWKQISTSYKNHHDKSIIIFTSINIAPSMTKSTNKTIEAPTIKQKRSHSAKTANNKPATKSWIIYYFHLSNYQKSFSGYHFFRFFFCEIRNFFSIQLNKSLGTRSKCLYMIFLSIFLLSLEVFYYWIIRVFFTISIKVLNNFSQYWRLGFFLYHKKDFSTIYNYSYSYTYNHIPNHIYAYHLSIRSLEFVL